MRPEKHPAHLRKRGPKPKPIVDRPQASTGDWIDPPEFASALRLHIHRHGETYWRLHQAIVRECETFDRKTLQSWGAGAKTPRSASSLAMLARIEDRYLLPRGYFAAKLPRSGRAVVHRIAGVSEVESRRLAWHLPDDFGSRPQAERDEILAWVRTTIIAGSTDYRRYQSEALRNRFALRFPDIEMMAAGAMAPGHRDAGLAAPPRLVQDVASLVRFKTATLTAIGEQRSGVWGRETVEQKVEHLALLFGALCADPAGPVRGAGTPRASLTLGLLAFPKVWDWYLGWREGRRGFFTSWEADMLELAKALTREKTGWLRQNPDVAQGLTAIPGLIEADDLDEALRDWNAACGRMHAHAAARAGEVRRVARVHRDPFEPILAVLEADSPLGEYRRITTEILGRLPDRRRHPRAAAEAVRGFLMLRLGLHLGVRQKNLRQLMLCPRGITPRSERQLESMRRGELRWSVRDGGWEVVIPSVAFKNASSSFFGGRPFRLLLPDLDGLYVQLDDYVRLHRSTLLAGAEDPGTLFVKSVKRISVDASYDRNGFYEAWRLVIQRYGIRNPYTGKGAIAGLLPHGPHNVRDVLATHILKQTGSYEQASYAIQDTPEMVREHYGRFLPQDKAALAAEILNRVWAA